MLKCIKLLAVLCLSCFLFCSELDKTQGSLNPLDPNYSGDYELIITPPSYDTLLTEATYTFTYTTGTDTFVSVNVISPDSTIMIVETITENEIGVRFKTPYSGNIVLSGKQLNGKTVEDSIAVEIIYDSKLELLPLVYFSDTLYEISRGEEVTLIASDTTGRSLSYVWQFGEFAAETTTVGTITKQFEASDTMMAYVYGLDRYGRASDADSAQIIVLPLLEYSVTLDIKDTLRINQRTYFSCAVNNEAKLTKNGGKYYWKIVLGKSSYDTSGAELTKISWTPKDSGSFYVSVYVKDTLGNKSSKAQSASVIRLYKPTVTFVEDTVMVQGGEVFPVSVVAFDTDSLGEIDSLYFDLNSDGTYETVTKDTVVSATFTKSGTKQITAYAKDKEGIKSLVDTLVVMVSSNKPYFAQGTNDTTVFKDSSLVIRVTPLPGDSDVEIDSCFWVVKGTQTFTLVTKEATLPMTFSTVGEDTIIVSCKDIDGVESIYADTIIVTVSLGAPSIDSLTVDTIAWAQEKVNCRVNGQDHNGTVTKWAVYWGDADTFEISTIGNEFSHAYTQSGVFTIKSYVEDNGGNKSDTVVQTIRIKDSKPIVKSININTNTGSLIYINDMAVFTVKGIDPNSDIDTIRAVFGDKTVSMAVSADSAVFSNVFLKAGADTVRFTIKDGKGQSVDSVFAVNVLLGEPMVSSFVSDSSTIWIKGLNRYWVKVSDPNGFIKKIYVNWDGGNVAQEEITVNGNFNAIDTFFTHAFDTTGGVKSVNVWVVDEDSVVSSIKETSFTVRKGTPTLWGDIKGVNGEPDTLLVVIDKGLNPKYDCTPNVFDTNGTIVALYYGVENDFSMAEKCTTGSFEMQFNRAFIHNALPYYFWVKDDDGLVSGKEFAIYADSVPEAFTGVDKNIDPQNNKVTFSWGNGLDSQDSLNTEIRILIKKGDSLTTADNTAEFVALDWTKASVLKNKDEVDVQTRPFIWTYDKPIERGVVYYYQIISRDARGNTTKSDVKELFK